MGSRLRDNVKQLFECFCEVAGPQGNNEAWIIQKYPDNYKNDCVMQNISKFAYPCKFEKTFIEHFSFVLTGEQSEWSFGYCRHDPKGQTALVLYSYLPWHESFYKLLNCIADIMNSNKPDVLSIFLEEIIQSEVPDSGTIRVLYDHTEYICQVPSHFQLPSIPENRNLSEYYNAVEPINMLQIFASMLNERRIIITSKRLSRLSACVQAANALIYPMCWQNIFIPVLPSHLIEYVTASMPFLIGVHDSLLQSQMTEVGDAVILNADTNVIISPYDDLNSLPQDVVHTLKKQLRNKPTIIGDGVSRAFLRALVQLIGGYRDGLKLQQGEAITFNKESFVESRPTAMQPFLRNLLHIQMFDQFIVERLNILNSNMGFSDEFELETSNYMDKSSKKFKQQYKEWTSQFKKEGSALFKNVRVRISGSGKDVIGAYKGLKSRLKDQPVKNDEDQKSNSAPNSPTHLRKKTMSAPLQSNKYSALDLASSSSPDLSPLDTNMDLLADLQDFIYPGCSPTSAQKTLQGDLEVMSSKSKEEPDLIRLDSTPSIDEDRSTLPSASYTGVENPLYLFFTPTQQTNSNETHVTDPPKQDVETSSFKQNIEYFNKLSLTTSPIGSKSPSLNNNQSFQTNLKSNVDWFANRDMNSHTSNLNTFLSNQNRKLTSQSNGAIVRPNTFITQPVVQPNRKSTQPVVLDTMCTQPVVQPNTMSTQPVVQPNTMSTFKSDNPLRTFQSDHIENTSSGGPINRKFSYNSYTNSQANEFFDSILSKNNNDSKKLNGFPSNNVASSSSSAQNTFPFQKANSTLSSFITNESRAAFLNQQLGPDISNLQTKKSLNEWTKFD